MIFKTVHVQSADTKEFFDGVNKGIADLQSLGLIVEIQYQPVSAKDEYDYTVYTALLIGRKKCGVE